MELELAVGIICASVIVAVLYFWFRQFKDNEIVLVGGFGKYYFGWHAEGNGVYSATKWLVFIYLPIFPLERQVFKPLDDPEARKSPTLIEIVGALAGAAVEEKYLFVILSREHLRFREILKTYLNVYVLIPIALIWPIGVFLLVAPLIRKIPNLSDSDWFIYVFFAIGMAYFIYFYAVILKAVRKTYCFREYERDSISSPPTPT